MTTDITSFTIGALADAAAVNVETIRFYQRKGLMPSPVRLSGSIRRYAATDLARVRFIKSAQRLGFSLDEVSDLLRLEDGTHCGEARALAGASSRTCATSSRCCAASSQHLANWWCSVARHVVP